MYCEDNLSLVNEEFDKVIYFVYFVEEICCNWLFFVIKCGFIGFGFFIVVFLIFVVFIYGLKILFLVQRGIGKDSFCGECYI